MGHLQRIATYGMPNGSRAPTREPALTKAELEKEEQLRCTEQHGAHGAAPSPSPACPQAWSRFATAALLPLVAGLVFFPARRTNVPRRFAWLVSTPASGLRLFGHERSQVCATCLPAHALHSAVMGSAAQRRLAGRSCFTNNGERLRRRRPRPRLRLRLRLRLRRYWRSFCIWYCGWNCGCISYCIWYCGWYCCYIALTADAMADPPRTLVRCGSTRIGSKTRSNT